MYTPQVILRGAARRNKLAVTIAGMIDDNFEAMLNSNGREQARIDRYNEAEIQKIKTHNEAYIAVLESGGIINYHQGTRLLDFNEGSAEIAIVAWKNLQDEFYKYESLGDGKGDFEAWANARSNLPEYAEGT
jgi:hypothetical protein